MQLHATQRAPVPERVSRRACPYRTVPTCRRVGTCPQAIRSATVDLLVGTDPVPVTIGVHRVGTYSDFKVGGPGVRGRAARGARVQRHGWVAGAGAGAGDSVEAYGTCVVG